MLYVIESSSLKKAKMCSHLQLIASLFHPVSHCDQSMCGMAPPLSPTSSYGYIASSQVAHTGCGTARCPWTIQVPEGQRINLTLYDFTVSESTCEQFGEIADGSRHEQIPSCLKQRHLMFYKSTTNVIKLTLSQSQPQGFLIKYEGTSS